MFGDIFLPRLNEKVVVFGITVIIFQKVADISPFTGGDACGLGNTSSLCGAGEWEKEKEAVNPIQKLSPKNSFSVIPSPVTLPIRA